MVIFEKIIPREKVMKKILWLLVFILVCGIGYFFIDKYVIYKETSYKKVSFGEANFLVVDSWKSYSISDGSEIYSNT